MICMNNYDPIDENTFSVAVVIPCFKVKRHIIDLLKSIGKEVDYILVIDDGCPEHSGQHVEQSCNDPRVKVIHIGHNKGVGGAVLRGYQEALNLGASIIVKLDGDGQMDPKLIAKFIAPIINKEADYTKGNRFYNIEKLKYMPSSRLFGNAVLSFITKMSSGYWHLFDPANGYTAIHSDAAKQLPFEKISNKFFFESDILFRLNTIRAVVMDIPMDAKYHDEISNLKISNVIPEFLFKHFRNTIKRVFYNYYLRDMSICSLELPLGICLFLSGFSYGVYHWINSFLKNMTTPAGTVMLAALPVLMGTQFILAFLNYDINNIPKQPLQKYK